MEFHVLGRLIILLNKAEDLGRQWLILIYFVITVKLIVFVSCILLSKNNFNHNLNNFSSSKLLLN